MKMIQHLLHVLPKYYNLNLIEVIPTRLPSSSCSKCSKFCHTDLICEDLHICGPIQNSMSSQDITS